MYKKRFKQIYIYWVFFLFFMIFVPIFALVKMVSFSRKIYHGVLMIEYPCFYFSVIDATGKPEAGILDGSLRWLGSYDECKRISYHNETMALNIKGKYSILQIPFGTSANAVGIIIMLYCSIIIIM